MKLLCIYDNRPWKTLPFRTSSHPSTALQGHSIVVAHSCTETFKIFETTSEPFDMILCQLHIPRMSKVGLRTNRWYGEEIHKESNVLGIRAFGFLLPREMSCAEFEAKSANQVCIACNESWTVTDEIAWRAFYNKLSSKLCD